MKINSDVSYEWVKQFGSNRDESDSAVAIDSEDNIYVARYFFETIDFGKDFYEVYKKWLKWNTYEKKL